MSTELNVSGDTLTAEYGVIASTNGVDDCIESGAFSQLCESQLDEWLEQPGLRVLLFVGPPKRRRDAHDVAIALRELIRSYAKTSAAAVLASDQEDQQLSRFRINATPSLALCVRGDVVEVVPGVRDWADYAAIFRRYLGDPRHD